jgi:hypothetical protein
MKGINTPQGKLWKAEAFPFVPGTRLTEGSSMRQIRAWHEIASFSGMKLPAPTCM